MVFDYYLSPVQRYLATATNPILKTLTGCTFCQGCEAGFVIQLLYCEFTPRGIAIAFLNGISAGFVAMSWQQFVEKGEVIDWDEAGFGDEIVVEEE